MHDLCEPDQRRVARQPEIIYEHVERALAVPVGVLRAGSIVGMGSFPGRHLKHLVAADEQEVGLRIDEPPDQPWAGDPVHVRVLPGDPFHAASLLWLGDWPPGAGGPVIGSWPVAPGRRPRAAWDRPDSRARPTGSLRAQPQSAMS